MNLKTLKKSKGHVAFIGDFEYYLQSGELYRAKIADAFDLNGYRASRWEAPERMVKDMVGQAIKVAKKFGDAYLVDKKWRAKIEEEKTMSKLEGLLEELRGVIGEGFNMFDLKMNAQKILEKKIKKQYKSCFKDDSFDAYERDFYNSIGQWAGNIAKAIIDAERRGDGDFSSLDHHNGGRMNLAMILFNLDAKGSRDKIADELRDIEDEMVSSVYG